MIRSTRGFVALVMFALAGCQGEEEVVQRFTAEIHAAPFPVRAGSELELTDEVRERVETLAGVQALGGVRGAVGRDRIAYVELAKVLDETQTRRLLSHRSAIVRAYSGYHWAITQPDELGALWPLLTDVATLRTARGCVARQGLVVEIVFRELCSIVRGARSAPVRAQAEELLVRSIEADVPGSALAFSCLLESRTASARTLAIRRLKSPKVAEVRHAIASLARLGSRDVPLDRLAGLVTHSDEGVGLALARVLASQRDPRARKLLEDLEARAVLDVLNMATTALRCGPWVPREEIVAIVSDHFFPGVDSTACYDIVLERGGVAEVDMLLEAGLLRWPRNRNMGFPISPELTERMRALLTAHGPESLEYDLALTYLARIRDKEASGAFAMLLASPVPASQSLNEAAVTALAIIDPVSAVPILRAALSYDDWTRRLAAARALYELDDRASIPLIAAAAYTGYPRYDADIEEYARRLSLMSP